VSLGGCAGGSSGLSPDDPAFSGLPAAVVMEVLDSPRAHEAADGVERANILPMYQGMVRNFVLCRSGLKAYQEWVSTGSASALEPQPKPDRPLAFSDKDMNADIARFRQHLASGDISLLQSELTAPTGCGDWIPAKPGDATGPTIADVVNGKS
jgi:hypothetical protein